MFLRKVIKEVTSCPSFPSSAGCVVGVLTGLTLFASGEKRHARDAAELKKVQDASQSTYSDKSDQILARGHLRVRKS